MNIPVRRVAWKPCWRIIPSRFPPIDLFERVADAADLEAAVELESLTNPRIRDEVGEIRMVPEADRIAGPGSSVIMAAFTHLNPDGSRFGDGAYGVCYAAAELETAVAETRHHRERFMRATRQGSMEFDMRVYVLDLAGDLHDIRGMADALSEVYDRHDYSAGQSLGRRLRDAGAFGIAYDSVRGAGGDCTAVFRPPVLSNCRQERHLCYVWDGERIGTIYEKREFP